MLFVIRCTAEDFKQFQKYVDNIKVQGHGTKYVIFFIHSVFIIFPTNNKTCMVC